MEKLVSLIILVGSNGISSIKGSATILHSLLKTEFLLLTKL